jgi:hypothetical protein
MDLALTLARRRRRGPGRRSRESWAATASQLRGPLYAADGAGPAYQGGFGRSGSGRGMTVSASVAHVGPWGELDVDTSDESPWGDREFDDYRLASDWLHRALRPGRLTFPLTVTADRWERDVVVDGQLWPFVFVGDGSAWCRAGTVGGRQVGASATGWPHERLALRTIKPRAVSDEVPDRAQDGA